MPSTKTTMLAGASSGSGTNSLSTSAMIGSIFVMAREMVGWLTPKSSPRTSSVMLFFSYITVTLTACPSVKEWGLPIPLDQYSILAKTSWQSSANCSMVRPVVRCVRNGSPGALRILW